MEKKDLLYWLNQFFLEKKQEKCKEKQALIKVCKTTLKDVQIKGLAGLASRPQIIFE